MKVKQNKQITIMLMGYQRCHIGYLTMLEDFPLTPRPSSLSPFFSMHMVVAAPSPNLCHFTFWFTCNHHVHGEKRRQRRGVNGKSSSMVR
jgi:hypothetical protein